MRLRHLQLLCCAIASAVLVSGCQPGKRLRKANVDQVTTGMARKQVESILGLPNSAESKDMDITKKITYVYTQGDESVTIIFWDDKVETKESTFKD